MTCPCRHCRCRLATVTDTRLWTPSPRTSTPRLTLEASYPGSHNATLVSDGFFDDDGRLYCEQTACATNSNLFLSFSPCDGSREFCTPLIHVLISALCYIVCLFTSYASPLILFSAFFLTYLLPYLSFPLRINPLCFQAGVVRGNQTWAFGQPLTICSVVCCLAHGHLSVVARPSCLWQDAQWPWVSPKPVY